LREVRRYIFRPLVLETGDDANEYWFGLNVHDDSIDVERLPFALIPAEGMTAAELSVVRHWFEMPGDDPAWLPPAE
jgi:hypothetical protein